MSERRIAVYLDQYKPLREIVFEAMRDAILQQVLKPGERLMESQLAREMGVSRTPVREALRKLELEGFIYVLPRKGAFVAELSLKDLNELFEIRTTLEALACGLAAARATPEEIEDMEKCLIRQREALEIDDTRVTVKEDVNLHDLIYKAARNTRLVHTLNNIREQFYRMRLVTTSLPGRKKISLEHHRKIVEAISEHNVELAQLRAEEHITDSRQMILRHYTSKK